MFKEGDIIQVVDFSNAFPNTPDKLELGHPYRKLGEGTCVVTSDLASTWVSLKNLKNGYRNSIYNWRCSLVRGKNPDWEV